MEYEARRHRSRSLEQMLPTHSYSQSSLHWEEARSRSLPRHLGRRRREEELEEQERCLTDRLRRRADYMDRDRADLIDRSIELLLHVVIMLLFFVLLQWMYRIRHLPLSE